MSDRARDEQFDAMIAIPDRRIRVRYRTGLGGDGWYRAELARAEEALRTDTPYAAYLYRWLAVRAIEAWDLRDEHGRPVAITEGGLNQLPIGGLQRIVREATQL